MGNKAGCVTSAEYEHLLSALTEYHHSLTEIAAYANDDEFLGRLKNGPRGSSQYYKRMDASEFLGR